MVKIAIDTLGGDKSPDANIEGAISALDKYSDISLVFLGCEKAIVQKLDSLKISPEKRERVEIIDAPDIITGEDKPTDAIRLKKDSSMVRAMKLLREDESVKALISTGATGALVALATLRIGRLRGVRRPAFCPIMPTMNGGIVAVCDSGANVECTPRQLCEFASMGSVYLSEAFGIKEPRVALLNVGTESEKGDDLRKEAYKMLSELDNINFVGNMESRDLLSGKFDLVVCDGFAGNVLIKSTEGACLEMLKKLKKDINSKLINKIGALFMYKMFMEEKEFMNYQNYGGSVLLGCEKIIVKGHGSSDGKAVAVCVDQAYRMIENDISKKTESALSVLDKFDQIEDAGEKNNV